MSSIPKTTVGFKINFFDVVEGNSGTKFAQPIIELSTLSAIPVTVFYTTTLRPYGGATAGSDYTTTTASVTFAPGEMSKSISIPILGDNLYEAKESFYVDITEAIGATIVQNGAEGYRNNWVVVNIGNDDVSSTPPNNAPTLSSLGNSVKTTTEDKAVSISFAELAGKGNEVDVDGIVTSFVVKAVSSGTLKIGTTAATATAWSAANSTIDATKSAFWTPAANANGTLDAFTAVAKDNGGLESATAIQTKVAVTPVSDVFKFSSLSNLGVAGSPTAINGFVTSKASSNLNWRDKLDLTSIDAIPGGSDNPFQFSSTAPSTASNSGWIGKLWVTAAPDGALVNLSTDNDSSPEYQIKLIGVSPANVAAIDFSL